MGYHTEFEGQFKVSPVMMPEHIAYLNEFSSTRRMVRDAVQTETLSDPLREEVLLPVGIEGEYFVGNGDHNPNAFVEKSGVLTCAGQQHDDSILDYNRTPSTQPGLWCQWVAREEGTVIEWDGGEKFYAYVEWLKYIIDNFLTPWGYTINGTVEWSGEDMDDTGCIIVTDNDLSTKERTSLYA